MKISIVIGGTGTIGSAIVKLLKANGHQVRSITRSGEHQMDMENPESIRQFFSEIGTLDTIICTAGNASFGPLSKLTDEQINLGLTSKLLGQVNLCRFGLKALKPNGTINLTGGILAHHPWPETSNIAMANAGLEGFAKALALELPEGQRIMVIHPPLVKETAKVMGMDESQSPSAIEVAHTYLKGLKGNKNGDILFV
ncbi:short chain dehydrogenase [Flexithrix dorotheae]|uniref:short chain dehydrogenase n=1 Tax=Flexithrix dorotheae TaxID=70993 RepID=UPI000368388C|nr:short chain dehydrogenase [Flexithrix dorotheae]